MCVYVYMYVCMFQLKPCRLRRANHVGLRQLPPPNPCTSNSGIVEAMWLEQKSQHPSDIGVSKYIYKYIYFFLTISYFTYTRAKKHFFSSSPAPSRSDKDVSQDEMEWDEKEVVPIILPQMKASTLKEMFSGCTICK